MEFQVSDAVPYIAETLIIWDYLISIDDEVALFWACFGLLKLEGSRLSDMLEIVLKTIVDQIFVLSGKSQYHESSGIECVHYDDIRIATSGYFSESGICSSIDTTWIFTYVDRGDLSVIVMEGIMVVRAWAIVGRQPRVLWIFLGLLTLSTIASLGLCVLDIEHADGTYYFYFLPAIFLEVIVFAVVAYHAITYLRTLRSLQSSRSDALRPGPRPIMCLLFEDSILYFVIIIAVFTVVPLSPDSVPLSLSVASITATRMLLRLRKQALSDSAGQTSVQEEPLTFRAVSGGINPSSEGEEDESS
ncbi:hypothetical protein EDD85DRAFT_1026530 [Armillaria nabsnona]|nr:hypothetical protein EDD85DRAFT_1026530 [Armillaria nabsnona]